MWVVDRVTYCYSSLSRSIAESNGIGCREVAIFVMGSNFRMNVDFNL